MTDQPFGETALGGPGSSSLRVEAAIAAVRGNAAVVVGRRDSGQSIVVQAIDNPGSTPTTWPAPLGAVRPMLALTVRRFLALRPSFDGDAEVVLLRLPPRIERELIRRLADPCAKPNLPAHLLDALDVADSSCLERAAVKLMKLAGLIPAALVAPLDPVQGVPRGWAAAAGLAFVDADDVMGYEGEAAKNLRVVAEARVPLAKAEDARLVAFRPSAGTPEHLAIIVGAPDPRRPVLARLHSACLTGDLLGSLRCDCGDQLRGAIRFMSQAGGGVLLYLAQEGRGIGLVNKLRAYGLQDQGYDTIEANERLGFEPDERLYSPAAEMLALLGYGSVRLMTNNPDKIRALQRHGIEVAERVPHAFAANEHNRAYLETKAVRSGHHLPMAAGTGFAPA